jgi:hypothetical protein
MLYDRIKENYLLFFVVFLISENSSHSQTDTISYKWPFNPVTSARSIGGTFGEYRSTSSSGHFHNGTDISAAPGTPVLAVLPGRVAAAYDDEADGYNSYVRITSTINGQSKNITYYHTRPLVSVGQQIVEAQQISTIAIDHVHLIDYRLSGSLSNSHLNSLRPDGGLTIYTDIWKPNIRYVKFYLDNSDKQLSPSALGNKVDIIVHVEEVSNLGSASENNGAYKIGYKVFSADTQKIIYAPPDDGLRFTYYNKPNDAYVNLNYFQSESNTSKHVYIVTNGNGSSGVASTQIVNNNYWDVDAYPYGNYIVMVYAEDTRGNADTMFVSVTTAKIDITPPAPPILSSVTKDSTNYFTLAWKAPFDLDLKGYRLYYSTNGTTYNIKDNETVLTDLKNFHKYFYTGTNPLFLKLFAVDTNATPNLSTQSDVYGVRLLNDNKKILIVDGFDRHGGLSSWASEYHDFTVTHAKAFNLSFESCANEQIINGAVNLNSYDLVIWILGDESTADETFSSIEIEKVSSFLEGGGKLFVSGSEIAWDLEGQPNPRGQSTFFLRNYLKAKFVADDSNIGSVTGIGSTLFSDLQFNYGNKNSGSPYEEDYPDIIDTAGGSVPIIQYKENSFAGVAFTGAFNNSQSIGQLIYLAFPFETIHLATDREKVMTASLRYFGLTEPVSVENESILPKKYFIHQNFPNPFNPTTRIIYELPQPSQVKLIIFDVLGREVETLVRDLQTAGKYEVTFDANNLSSGIYFYRFSTDSFSDVKKMILIR